MVQTVEFPSLVPHPSPTPNLSVPFPLSLCHCCSTIAAGPDHTIPAPSPWLGLALGPSCRGKASTSSVFTSIPRMAPEATQRKHPILNNKQKDPIILSCCSTALWFRVISLTIEDIGTEKRGYFPEIAWELKTKKSHTDVTLQYHMCSCGRGEGHCE